MSQHATAHFLDSLQVDSSMKFMLKRVVGPPNKPFWYAQTAL